MSKFIFQHVYFGVASLRGIVHARAFLYNALFLFSFQTLDHLPLTDPENFGTPVVQVNNIATNSVLHVLNALIFFDFVTTCAQVRLVTWQQYQCLFHNLQMKTYCFMYITWI